MVSRKRLAIDGFNVDLPFPERLAANEGNFRVFLTRQGEKDRQVAVPKAQYGPPYVFARSYEGGRLRRWYTVNDAPCHP